MPWCPNCRVEYQQGFKACIDCYTDLVDELAPIEENIDNEIEYAGDAYLYSTTDCFEAEVIESFLNSNGIPVLKKFRGAGGFLNIYMGTTIFGVELYVPADLLEEARDIIVNSREAVKENGRPRYCRIYKIKQRRRTFKILWLMLFLWDFSSFL